MKSAFRGFLENMQLKMSGIIVRNDQIAYNCFTYVTTGCFYTHAYLCVNTAICPWNNVRLHLK